MSFLEGIPNVHLSLENTKIRLVLNAWKADKSELCVLSV